MANTTDTKSKKADREAEQKAARKKELAVIVEGLRTELTGDEQLLGFARGRIAGGWKGKLSIGPEAFFAPHINIGLTEKRVILQHIHLADGKPGEIVPHSFPLSDIVSVDFSDIETFDLPAESRLVFRLIQADQTFRLRLSGASNAAGAQAISEVFKSLTSAGQTARTSPTQRVCAICGHVQDQPSKFCPYCGALQVTEETIVPPVPVSDLEPSLFDSPPVEANENPEAILKPETEVNSEAVAARIEPDFDIVSPLPVPDDHWTFGVGATVHVTHKEDAHSPPSQSDLMPSAEATSFVEPEMSAEPEPFIVDPTIIDIGNHEAPTENQAELPAEQKGLDEFSRAVTAPVEMTVDVSVPSDFADAAALVFAKAEQASPAESQTPPFPVPAEPTPLESTAVTPIKTDLPARGRNYSGRLTLRIHIDHPRLKLNETICGSNPEEVVTTLKSKVSKEVPFALRLLINSMGTMNFAQEVVRRYNAAESMNVPIPQTYMEFLLAFQDLGYATILEN